ncbi:MAG: hypothetical protein H0S85_07835 [Desulfovibrionaceae bacterium]|jgi:hypothetical protein|nr:hypothetical protein [Desulfovibrionaceae bacterium]
MQDINEFNNLTVDVTDLAKGDYLRSRLDKLCADTCHTVDELYFEQHGRGLSPSESRKVVGKVKALLETITL